MTSLSEIFISFAAAGAVLGAELPEHVVDCGKYDGAACTGNGLGCVGDGWFSKTNTVGDTAKVNGVEICQQHGYDGVDARLYGGNWGHECRFPGTTENIGNRAGGALEDLGLTITWKCSGGETKPDEELEAEDIGPHPMPTGPKIEVFMVPSCTSEEEKQPIGLVWAPDKCQPDPMNPEFGTVIVSCLETGGMKVQVFDNPLCLMEGLETELDLMHGRCLNGLGEGDVHEGPHMWLLDDIVRKECGDPTFFPEPTSKPTSAVPQPLPPVNCVSVGDPHFRFFNDVRADFQGRGEFTFWETDGLTIQVRQGPNLLATHINTVSTNNAIAISGSQVCGNTFEIYAEDGGWMRYWKSGETTATEYFGVANVVAAIQNVDCPNVSAAGVTMGFRFDNAQMNVQVLGYGINICLHVEGQAYLDTDTGICTQRPQWDAELNCQGTLFTHYKEGDCSLLPRPVVIPFDINDCDAGLKAEAEKVCNQCPDTIDPQDCVYEVCALGGLDAAADLLKACQIDVQLAPPRDVHCSSLGDPHFLYFDTTRADFQDRGEFVLYETTGVSVMTRHGERPDIPQVTHVSTNHAVSVMGDWTCGRNFEFFHDGPNPKAANHLQAVPKLKYTDENGQVTIVTGKPDIVDLLTQRNRCNDMQIGTRGDIYEFSFEGGNVRTRVQLVWWGINVWVDVAGPYYLDSDSGICTKREGGFEQVDCDKSNFTEYPEGDCPELPRTFVPPTPVLETCRPDLKAAAREKCGKCPDVVDVDDCIFEVCAIGNISAAEQLLVACKGDQPIVPAPVPNPAPKPDVQCISSGDPHFRYFDRSGGDFQSRGHFTLYKTDSWEVQVRQGVHLTLAPTHPAYDLVSTNNAFVVAGDWMCGYTIEVEAVGPSMKVTDSNGNVETHNGKADILDRVSSIDCPKISVNGDVVSFGDRSDYQMRWQLQSWGINIWIDVRGENYLDSDSGICTKREGWTEPLECADVLFTEFPEGKSCEEEKENDKDIEPVSIEDTDCDPALKQEAEEVCQRCPNTVAPRDCVLETCILGTIDAAEELLKACALAPPTECGESGKVARKTGEKLNKALKKVLGSKRKADTSCACKDACEEVGGTEWSWKPKNGRCACFQGAEKIEYSSRQKKMVGTIGDSSATVSRKA